MPRPSKRPSFPSTAQVMDLVLAGRVQSDDCVIGRLLVESSIYHEGLWYKLTLRTTDLEDIKATFGNNGQPDNIRDPEFPDRLA